LDYPFFTSQNVSLLENKFFNIGLLIFGLGVLGLTVLLWPVAAIVRKHYGKRLDYTPSESRSRLLARIVSILFLVFYVGWLSLLSLSDDPKGINGLPPWIVAFGILGVICTIGTTLVWLNAVRSLRNPARWICDETARPYSGARLLGACLVGFHLELDELQYPFTDCRASWPDRMLSPAP
jgi:uncharacterized membrane protein (DUF485 family)